MLFEEHVMQFEIRHEIEQFKEGFWYPLIHKLHMFGVKQVWQLVMEQVETVEQLVDGVE